MKYAILFAYLLIAVYLRAQPPPAQLPSLLDGTTIQMPVLQKDQDPDDFIRENIFVKVWANKTKAYVGEPILVTYKLYTSLNSQARVSRQPAFNGCSVTELSSENELHETSIKGKLFHVFVIRKVQLIPLEEGSLQLGQALVDNVVQLLHPDGSSTENFSITVQNDPLEIDVEPLPATGKPVQFSGLVGNYSIAASIDSDKVPAGQDATLRVTISGNGNIAGVHAPVINWPPGTEHFDGSDTQHIDLGDFPVRGYKVFDIPFIGDKEGQIIIEPIAFSFFDPDRKMYKTVSTGSIPVVITKAVSRSDELKNIVTEDVTNRKYLWIVAAIAGAVLFTWLIASGSKPKGLLNKEKNLPGEQNSVTGIPVEETKNDASPDIFAELNELGSISTPQIFFSSTRIFLIKMLQTKLRSGCISEYELIMLMKEKDAYTEIAMGCEQIFDTCNRNLYSPLGESDLQERTYFELTSLVKRLYELG